MHQYVADHTKIRRCAFVFGVLLTIKKKKDRSIAPIVKDGHTFHNQSVRADLNTGPLIVQNMKKNSSSSCCTPTIRGEIRKARASNYDFASGIMEFIDNAIDADATTIRLDIRERTGTGHPHKIIISDNARGGIPFAKIGAIFSWTFERARRATDIGEYGTGFKTAAVNIAHKLTLLTKDSDQDECAQAIADWQDMSDEETFEPKIMRITNEYYHDYHPFSTGTTFILEGLRNEMLRLPSASDTTMTILVNQLYNTIAYVYRYILHEHPAIDIILKGVWIPDTDIKECTIRHHPLFLGDAVAAEPVRNVHARIIKTMVRVYKDTLQYYRACYNHGSDDKWQVVQFLEKRKNGNNHLKSYEVPLSTFDGMRCIDTLVFFTVLHLDAEYSEMCATLNPTGTVDIIRKGRVVGRDMSMRGTSPRTAEQLTRFVKHEIWYNSYELNAPLGIQYNKRNSHGWLQENDLRFVLEHIQQLHERECTRYDRDHPVRRAAAAAAAVADAAAPSSTVVTVATTTSSTSSSTSDEDTRKQPRRNFSTQIKIQTLNRQECRDRVLDFVLKDNILLFEYDHKNGEPSINSKENCQALSVITHAVKTHCPETFQRLEHSETDRARFTVDLLNCITRSKIFAEAYTAKRIITMAADPSSAHLLQHGIFRFVGDGDGDGTNA